MRRKNDQNAFITRNIIAGVGNVQTAGHIGVAKLCGFVPLMCNQGGAQNSRNLTDQIRQANLKLIILWCYTYRIGPRHNKRLPTHVFHDVKI